MILFLAETLFPPPHFPPLSSSFSLLLYFLNKSAIDKINNKQQILLSNLIFVLHLEERLTILDHELRLCDDRACSENRTMPHPHNVVARPGTG